MNVDYTKLLKAEMGNRGMADYSKQLKAEMGNEEAKLPKTGLTGNG